MTLNPRKLRIFPPTSPIAVHNRPRVPGSCARSTSKVAENAAVGRDIEYPGAKGSTPVWRDNAVSPNRVPDLFSGALEIKSQIIGSEQGEKL